jgi:hypothetical protein
VRVLARLGVQTLLRGEHVAVCRPRARDGVLHVPLAEVGGGHAAVLRGELELRRGLVVQPRRGVARIVCVAQFQTLTSR